MASFLAATRQSFCALVLASILGVGYAFSMAATDISDAEMNAVFEEVKTPFKYGVLLKSDDPKTMYDCPSVFRHNGRWYMMFVQITDKVGYETMLAVSDDLLKWDIQGKVLPFTQNTWDCWQADGGIALQDFNWGGSLELQPFDGKYWLSYLGGHQQGYETDPLSIGLAYTEYPEKAEPWMRLPNNPVMQPSDADVRPFEAKTLYKSNIIWDKAQKLGAPFVMYYNGKQQGNRGWERIGMALSHDMKSWKRFGDGPVIDNITGISGDPQIVKIGDLWVMFYFGHVWKPKAFDTFAVSRDMVNWTKWQGQHLVEPSQPWDKTFAHKPWVIKYDGVVYHFYCAVGEQGRVIGLATSKDLRK